MIIAKPEWFKRRKYTGWGATPSDWRGWVYIAVFILIVFGFQSLPFLNALTRFIFMIIAFIFLIVDMSDVMVKLNRDEREIIHEAKAERNALWVIVAILAAGLAYQVASSSVAQEVKFDWVIVIALFAGLAVKAISNIYFDKRD